MLGLRSAPRVPPGAGLLVVLLVALAGLLPAQQPPQFEPIAPGWPGPAGAGAERVSPANPLGDDVQRAAGLPIVDVRIVGNETVSEDEVISRLRTRTDREFDPETVQGDKRKLLSSGLFREVAIRWQQVREGVVVTFEVLERPTIRYIRFLGDRGLGEKGLLRESGLEVGEALNVYTVQEARLKLEELYHRSGFAKAQVEIAEGDQPGDRGVVFQIAEGPLVRLASVSFVGNRLANDGRLRAVLRRNLIEYRPGSKVDFARVDEDIERLTAYYRSFGYFQAKISRIADFDDSQKWLALQFVVSEGPQYAIRNVEVVGNERFPDQALKGQMELAPGDFFDQGRMNRDVSMLRDLYGSQGHIFADIVAQPRFLLDEPALDMVYNVTEGDQFRVGRINVQIAGEYPHTRDSVVRNRLSIKPGDIVDIREVRASERRLKASQLFENNPAEGKTPKIVIRPPQLDEAERLIANRDGSSIRGQSPDGPAGSRVRYVDLEVYLPPAISAQDEGRGRR